MPYHVYIGPFELPVPPEKIELKANGKNDTVNLADGTEINLLQTPGLSELTMTILLPSVSYAFAPQAQTPEYYLTAFEQYMVKKQPFQFTVIRSLPGGKLLHKTNMPVTLEDYTATDDVAEGFDTKVKLSLMQYRPYETGLIPVTVNADGTYTAQAPSRPDTREKPTSYAVMPGDTLPNIALKLLGTTAAYAALAARNNLSDPLHPPEGTVLQLE